MFVRIAVTILASVIGSTAFAQPKSATIACTKDLIEKGNTFEVVGSIKSSNSEVTYSDAGDSDVTLSMQNAVLTITDSGRVLCSNPIPTFTFGLRMPKAWLQAPANAGALALAMRCSSMFDRTDGAASLSLVVSAMDKLTAFDPSLSATTFAARTKLDQAALRFFSCKR